MPGTGGSKRRAAKSLLDTRDQKHAKTSLQDAPVLPDANVSVAHQSLAAAGKEGSEEEAQGASLNFASRQEELDDIKDVLDGKIPEVSCVHKNSTYKGHVNELQERHGFGVAVWSDGNEYRGEWHHNRMHGYGLFKWKNGNTYRGRWSNGVMHGFGEKRMIQNDVYTGMWKKGQASGTGTKVFSCGDRHDGRYKKDARCGHGTYYWSNGDKYEGGWKAGRMSGHGTKYMCDGSVYVGEWKEDMANGHGRKTFKDGDEHVGLYKDDRRHGFGKYRFSNGDVYEGMWEFGDQSGLGTYTYGKGGVFSGAWEKGRKHGLGVSSTTAAPFQSHKELWNHGKLWYRRLMEEYAPAHSLRFSSDVKHAAEMQRLKKERQRLAEEVNDSAPGPVGEKNCVVCFDKKVSMVCVPCGHLGTCKYCVQRLPSCPVCRTPIEQAVRVFAVGIEHSSNDAE